MLHKYLLSREREREIYLHRGRESTHSRDTSNICTGEIKMHICAGEREIFVQRERCAQIDTYMCRRERERCAETFI